MKTLTLCKQNIRVDDYNMISLTDMWKASGCKNQHRPKYYLENAKTLEFIDALKAKGGIPPLKITKGGKHSGTWAHKFVAYDYAGWIDPNFKVGTFTVLDNYFSGELVKPQQELQDFVIRERISETLGSIHGKGLWLRKEEKRLLGKEAAILLAKYQHQLPFELLS